MYKVKNKNTMFENIISGIQLFDKNYHQKLNHFLEAEKVTNDFFNNLFITYSLFIYYLFVLLL